MFPTLRKYYGFSTLATMVALVLAFAIGMWMNPAEHGLGGALSTMTTVAILGILEISLSFDNAVANAKVLENWDEKWIKRFLNWGLPLAVFGMRGVFPILIVSVTTGLGFFEVGGMALTNPSEYAKHLTAVHHEVAGFGGAFLFMVAIGFFVQEKHVYWLEAIETRLTKLGQIEGVAAAITLIIVLLVSKMFPNHEHGQEFFIAGVWGVVVFILSHGLGAFLGDGKVVRAGVLGFVYLEVLDASFSFDGVIGAFVLTNYLPVIALGLGVGALFVRSMTIHLVEAKTLSEFRYLEHGAFYAIFALACMMFVSGLGHEMPEWLTGLIGASFIGVAFVNSLSFNRRAKLQPAI